MVISKIIKIGYTKDNKTVEENLRKMGIEPLRWAIVGVNPNELFVSVSFVQK